MNLSGANETVASSVEHESQTFSGLTVYKGKACGTAICMSSSDLEIPQFQIEECDADYECRRLLQAIQTVEKHLTAMEQDLASDETAPLEASTFLDVYRTILQDPVIKEETQGIIRTQLVNAEWALSLRLEQSRREFEAIDNDYLRERIEDVAYVVTRIQRTLTGQRSTPTSANEEDALDTPVIIVADSLDPADMLQLRERDDLDLVGLIIAEGSPTSHTAILAQSFEIPTLIGLQEDAVLSTGTELLIDADNGIVQTWPGEREKAAALASWRQLRKRRQSLRQIRQKKASTEDGTVVALLANIALPDDLADVRRSGADGVGLFRTEFLFLNRTDLPTEDELYKSFKRVSRTLSGQSVTIRLADLGGDKMLSDESFALLSDSDSPVETELNPALGLRGLRFSFAYPELLRIQLRAIMRVAAEYRVSLLLPMICDPEDVRRLKCFMDETDRLLTEEDVRHTADIPLGGMIEVPAALEMLPELSKELDFFSIGTNDLVQYMLAADRTNSAVYQPDDEYHPAVLRVLYRAIKTLRDAERPVSVCGEMAGRPEMTAFFVGIGCRRLSMDPSHIPAVKEKVLHLNVTDCTALSRSLIRRQSRDSVRRALEETSDTTETS